MKFHFNFNSFDYFSYWKWIFVILFLYDLKIEKFMNCSSGIRLNVPRVRLPFFDTLSVNFTLHVDTPGCFKWTASRSDIIKLKTADGKDFDLDGIECSDSVVLSTVPRATITFPASATIFAAELNTKENVRCDVIVDKIEGIKIVTTNSYVHLEEAPSKFQLRGYGAHGNEFSTMEGIPIKWGLEVAPSSPSQLDPRNVVRFLRFSESLYEAKEPIAALERRGLQGSEVLVEGLKTGSVLVTAKIQSSMYKHIPKADVKIIAVANLILEPTDMYIVPETTVPLKLSQMKQGKLYALKLPSDTYTFEVENTTVASYDMVSCSVTGLNFGETKITVRDRNHLDNGLSEVLTAYIYVREPKFISFGIRPFGLWSLMIGQIYTITVDVFDSDSQKLYVGNNIFLQTTFDETFFKSEFKSANGTFYVGKPIKTGIGRITSELKHFVKADGTLIKPISSLKTSAEMEIYQRIAINPKLTVLPWDPNTSPIHQIHFKASGGNGIFIWKSSNSTVVSINQNGEGRTESYGVSEISAAMTINQNNRGTSKVYVLKPTSMKIVDHIVEAEIGTAILIPLAFYTLIPQGGLLGSENEADEVLIPFTSCRNLNFKVKIEDPKFVYDSKSYYAHSKPACAYLPVIGHQLGSTVVTVTYETEDLKFEDSVTVSTFKPLTVVEPSTTKTTLAVGSSRQIVYEGGPRPLLERVGDFSRRILISNTTVAKVKEIPNGHLKDDLYVYEVLCLEIGEAFVTLEIGNSRETQDRIPVRRTSDVKVICGDPTKIYFKIEPMSKDSLTTKCPHYISSAQIVRIPVPNYEPIMVSVVVKDSKGNRFDNITSLQINWKTSLDLLSFKYPKFIETESISLSDYIVPGKNFQTLLPTGKSGNVEITAEIVGYRSNVLKTMPIKSGMKLSKIEESLEYLYQRSFSMELQLVSDVTLKSDSLSLFNHPSSKALIKVIEGSGYFEISTEPNSYVEAIYNENTRMITVKPLSEGEVKILVKDLCLFKKQAAEMKLKVNSVGTIVVQGPDKIQVGNSSVITVLISDKFGVPFTTKDLNLINLETMSVTEELINVERIEETEMIQFRITGKNIGDATIAFSANGSARTSKSEIKRINVFPPLKLNPKQLTILVGSVYQVKAEGGPRDDSVIEFSTDARNKIHLSSNGLINGVGIGRSRISARVFDQATDLTYSEDSMIVNVVNLAGIRIQTSVPKILLNEIMPVWVIGFSSNSLELDPSVLIGGSEKENLMTFEWSVGNTDKGILQHPFHNFGISGTIDQPYVRFVAKKTGFVTIKVLVNLTGTDSRFSAEIKVEVVEDLRILNMPILYKPILMTPHSEFTLKTNKDTTGVTSIKVASINNLLPSGILEEDGGEVESVIRISGGTQVKAGGKLGDAIVILNHVDSKSGATESSGFFISVRLISYHMITPQLPSNSTSSDESKKLEVMHKHIQFPIKVSFHDSLGRSFHVTSANPTIRPNRYDIVHVSNGIDNNTFIAESLGNGRLGLMSLNSDKSSTSSKDFLFVSIGDEIIPKIKKPDLDTNGTSGSITPEKRSSWWDSMYFQWFWNMGTVWVLVIPIVTLGFVHMIWKYQATGKDKTSKEFVFVTRPSPHTSTPRTSSNSGIHYTPSGLDGSGDSGGTTPTRRLYSTDCGTALNYRFVRNGASPSPSTNGSSTSHRSPSFFR